MTGAMDRPIEVEIEAGRNVGGAAATTNMDVRGSALSQAGRYRRGLLVGAAAIGAGAAVSGRTIGQYDDDGRAEYDDLINTIWRHSDSTDLPWPAVQRELVRYATLAANSLNIQPWRFRLLDSGILALPYFSPHASAGDFDGHELFVSLGCAVENMVQAAGAFGFRATARFNPGAGGIHVGLDPAAKSSSALFDAIPHRHTITARFDGRPVAPADLRMLSAAGHGNDVTMMLVTEPQQLETICRHVVATLEAQWDDGTFGAMMRPFIRIGYREALARRDGLLVCSHGALALPMAMRTVIERLRLGKGACVETLKGQIRSSAGIAVFASNRSDPAHWVQAGRCCQRFALQATALGIRSAVVNVPSEARAARAQLAADLGIGDRHPDALIRFGYGAATLRSLRRPVGQVILEA
jgi:nitroreductase